MNAKTLTLRVLFFLITISICNTSCNKAEDIDYVVVEDVLENNSKKSTFNEKKLFLEQNIGGTLLLTTNNYGVLALDANTTEEVAASEMDAFGISHTFYNHRNKKVYASDRLNMQIQILNEETLNSEGFIDLGSFQFPYFSNMKMATDALFKTLWVTNDVEKSVKVVDLETNTVVKTITLEGEPTDIVVSRNGGRAYVSIKDKSNRSSDKIALYSGLDFSRIKERRISKNPRLLLHPGKLFVASDRAGKLFVLDDRRLNVIDQNNFQGAHGMVSFRRDNSKIYMTNIFGNKLYSIDSNDIHNFSTINTIRAKPKNIDVNVNGTKVFVTHPGKTSNEISIYNINNQNEIIESGAIAVELGRNLTNPWGITYVKKFNN